MPASPQETPNDPEYAAQFLKILNNRSKQDESGGNTRNRGFVVLVRGGGSLKPLQSLCSEQTYNQCFTARYRLEPRAALGTLLAAFYSDLAKIFLRQDNLVGDFSPELSPHLWKMLAWFALPTAADSMAQSVEALEQDSPVDKELITRIRLSFKEIMDQVLSQEEAETFLRKIELITANSKGTFNAEYPRYVFETLSEQSLQRGDRLVFFCEIAEERGDLSEWESAKETLLTKLPERIGIVISGAPKEFKLTDNLRDPHFLELELPEVEPVTIAPSLSRFTQSSFHRDEPASRDELNVERYANAIARFILHKQTIPPLTIGIHGRWGKGKSSFMQMVNSELIKLSAANSVARDGATQTQRMKDLATKLANSDLALETLRAKKSLTDQEQQELAEKTDEYRKDFEAAERLAKTMEAEAEFISVWFNAWQFEDAKQTWAGLASRISGVMEGALSWRSRQWLKICYAWKERKSELILSILLPLAVVCIVAGLFSIGGFRNVVLPANTNSDLGGVLRLLVPAGSAFLTIWFVSSQFLKVAQPISERVLSYVRLPNYREQMGFQHRVKEDLKYVYSFLIDRKPRRLVVYIDDLDRCSEGKIIEILQAINLILADCKFFVLVGMDTEMIYRAIASRYESNDPDEFPRNYLRKIIQISFYLPETTRPRRLNYVSSLFSRNARSGLGAIAQPAPAKSQEPATAPQPTPSPSALSFDLTRVLEIAPASIEDVEDTVAELRAFHDYIEFLEDNPRQIKRLVNLHRLVKILLQDPNSPWSDERQRKLVKWMVFCDVWPFLLDDILAERDRTDLALVALKNEKGELEERAIKGGIVAVTEKDVAEARSLEISAEIERLQSSNCLLDLASRLKNSQLVLPYLKKFHAFASKDEDVIETRDIDEAFREAAHLSQLVRESPEISPGEEGRQRKSSGLAFFA